MDAGRIATLGPQEDEFALLLLGERSVYRGFIDPRRLGESAEMLSGAPNDSFERWLNFIRGIARSRADGRLLLKSPSHTFRLPFLRSQFPRAKYIWIGRHTGEVLASNVRMWRAMMQRYALWHCPPAMLEEFLLTALRACQDVLKQCLDEMTPENLLWIDFEELQGNPKLVLERVARFLQIGASNGAQSLACEVELALARIPIHPVSRERWPEDANTGSLSQTIAEIRRRFANT
jgi:hypothetical protein